MFHPTLHFTNVRNLNSIFFKSVDTTDLPDPLDLSIFSRISSTSEHSGINIKENIDTKDKLFNVTLYSFSYSRSIHFEWASHIKLTSKKPIYIKVVDYLKLNIHLFGNFIKYATRVITSKSKCMFWKRGLWCRWNLSFMKMMWNLS